MKQAYAFMVIGMRRERERGRAMASLIRLAVHASDENYKEALDTGNDDG